MLDQFLNEVCVSIVGKPGEELSKILNSKKHVNEFVIAKKMNITINQTRNLLYKLSDFGLVSSIRKKDKKKGWYTYFWRIEISKALQLLKQHVLDRKKKLEELIASREASQFYVCNRCNLEFPEADALGLNFLCTECGEVFELKDNSKLIKEFRKRIDSMDSNMAEIDVELAKEDAKLGKEKDKEKKKIAVEKEAVKVKKKAERKAINDAKKPKKVEKVKAIKKIAKKVIKKVTKSKKK